MFEKLIDLIIDLSKWLSPVAWVQPWEGGVRITSLMGKQIVKPIGPGLHLKLPIFQIIEVADIATTTVNLPPQSLTSRDGKGIAASGVVKYSIYDVTHLFTKVCDREDVIRDVALGAIASSIRVRTWEEILNNTDEMESEIHSSINDGILQFGYQIEKFTFTDLGLSKTIRFMQELPQH